MPVFVGKTIATKIKLHNGVEKRCECMKSRFLLEIGKIGVRAKLAKLSENYSFASKLIFLLGQSKIEKVCEWCGLGIVFSGVSGEIRDFGPIS